METAVKQRLTAQEYLALERKAETRSEFLDGEMFAMAGGTRRHSRLKVNIVSGLQRQLRTGACQVFDSDMRVKIEATGLYTYPDAHVACGDLRFEDEQEDVLLNPKVVFEVLSESSAAWDRGEKFRHYRRIESLEEYVLVSQETWLVEHYRRQPEATWVLETLEGPEAVLRLKSVTCSLPLPEIYENTGVPQTATPHAPPPPPSTKRKP